MRSVLAETDATGLLSSGLPAADVLEEAVERLIVDKRFADVPLGLYVIRGENVVLLGEVVRRAAEVALLHTPGLRHERARSRHARTSVARVHVWQHCVCVCGRMTPRRHTPRALC